VLFWNARDLEQKLADFQAYYNAARSHASLGGPHAVDLRQRTHAGPSRAGRCALGLTLPGLGPAPSGGLTTNSRRTGVKRRRGQRARSTTASWCRSAMISRCSETCERAMNRSEWSSEKTDATNRGYRTAYVISIVATSTVFSTARSGVRLFSRRCSSWMRRRNTFRMDFVRVRRFTASESIRC
jgi:hypothetical protein